MASSRFDQPWITAEIKRLTRQKARAWSRARDSGKIDHWNRYKELKKVTQRECRKAQDAYVQGTSSNVDDNTEKMADTNGSGDTNKCGDDTKVSDTKIESEVTKETEVKADVDTEKSIQKEEKSVSQVDDEVTNNVEKMDTEGIKDKTDVPETNSEKNETPDKVSEEDLAVLQAKVRKQIEYYFGDVNLMRDKFLLELIAKDDGWVELSTMLKFNRLAQLTTDCDLICSAIKHSTSGLLEVREDGLKIRRLPSRKLPENTKERRDEVMGRSVYAKKFPEDSTLDELTAYFTDNHGPMEQVFMRTYGIKDDRKFKGSVFVIFEKKADADKFVKADVIQYKGDDLIRLYKHDYFDKKAVEKGKKKRGSTETAEEKKKELENEDKEVASKMTPGAVLHLTGLSDTTKLTHVKTFFMDISPVSWVDIHATKKQAWVRFQAGVAQKSVHAARAANDGKLVINDTELESTVLRGDEELQYWKKLLMEIEAAKKQKRKPGGNFGKRKFQRKGEKFRGNKHKKFKADSDGDDNNDDDAAAENKDDSPPPKAAKLECSE